MVNTLATFTAASSREDAAAEVTAAATLDLSHGGSILALSLLLKANCMLSGRKEAWVYLEGRIGVALTMLMRVMMIE